MLTIMKAGDIIGGYTLIGEIATGGMGTVWRAQHPNLQRIVAIKFIRGGGVAGRDLHEAFVREAQHLSRLHSPQIVQITDFGLTDDDAPFIVTEYLEGEDLRTRLRREGPQPYLVVAVWAVEVLKALAEAHALGMIHRDLKPGNIFLQRLAGGAHEAVKVLDFGLAKVTSEEREVEDTLWPHAVVKGSPIYMSPEQAGGDEVSFATDHYALGATLYHLLTGEWVFSGSRAEILSAHIHRAPPDLRAHPTAANFPEELCDIVMGCLEKSPSDRPRSATALKLRLERLLEQREEHSETRSTASEPQAGHSLGVEQTAVTDDLAPDAMIFRSEHPSVRVTPKQDLHTRSDIFEFAPASDGAASEPAILDGLPHKIGLPPAASAEDQSDENSPDDAKDESLPAWFISESQVSEPSAHEDESQTPPKGGISSWLEEVDQPTLDSESGRHRAIPVKSPRVASSTMEDQKGSWGPLGDAQSQRPPDGSRPKGIRLQVVAIIACLGFAAWQLTRSSDPFERTPGEAEATAARALLQRIADEKAVANSRSGSDPSVVQAQERRDTDGVVEVTVAPGPARFVQRGTGKTLCKRANRCVVPIKASVEVRKEGFRTLVLSRDDLYDRRGYSWRVILRKP